MNPDGTAGAILSTEYPESISDIQNVLAPLVFGLKIPHLAVKLEMLTLIVRLMLLILL